MKQKYFNDGIVGNGKLTASFSKSGELLRLFYGSIDYKQFLEEFNIAIRDNFVEEDLLIDIIKQLNGKSNVVVTGRGASKKIIDVADLVSEVKEIKHPYNKGVPAQEGIEF